MPQTHLETRRERKRHKLQLHIVNTAMALFREQGFDHTTMEGIAAAADVAKRTLYSHFPAKEALVSAYWQNNMREKGELLPLLLETYANTRSRLLAVFLSAAEGFMDETEFARIHFSYQFQKIGSANPEELRSPFVHFLCTIMTTGQAEGDLRNDIEPMMLAMQVMLNFTATCLMWFANPESFSLEQRLSQTVDCFIDGAIKPN